MEHIKETRAEPPIWPNFWQSGWSVVLSPNGGSGVGMALRPWVPACRVRLHTSSRGALSELADALRARPGSSTGPTAGAPCSSSRSQPCLAAGRHGDVGIGGRRLVIAGLSALRRWPCLVAVPIHLSWSL